MGIRGIIKNGDECYCFHLLGVYYMNLIFNFITMMADLRYYNNII